jgi:hypothetical protein
MPEARKTKRALILTRIEATIISAGLADDELFFKDLPEETLARFRWGPSDTQRLKAKLFRVWPEVREEEIREELADLERLQAKSQKSEDVDGK